MRRLVGAVVVTVAWLGMQGVGGAACTAEGGAAVCSNNGNTTASLSSSPGSYGGVVYVGANDGPTVYADGNDTNPGAGAGWVGVSADSGVTCADSGYYGESSTCP